ncbi:hypothetical protein [Polaromonas sp. YR568]|uniref:hypothetical protein n=1 Tax=Polaromonas sp. YR568 TaxID=1855301 RepID=UPI00398BBF12
MDELRKTALEYFRFFEGSQNNPPAYSGAMWFLILGWLSFLSGNLAYVLGAKSADPISWYITLAMTGDVLLMFGLKHFRERKRQRLFDRLNTLDNSSFKSLDASRRHQLSKLFGCRYCEFADTAFRIRELQQLERTTVVGAQIGFASEFRDFLLDAKTREKLIQLALVVASIGVTLAATRPDSMDSFVEILTSSDFATLMSFLFGLGVFLCVAWISLKVGATALTDGFLFWRMNKSTAAWANERRVNYLLNDLVRLHKRKPLQK